MSWLDWMKPTHGRSEERSTSWRKRVGGALLVGGVVLGPATPLINDIFTNFPVTVVISAVLGWIVPSMSLATRLVVGYVISNIIGIAMMALGGWMLYAGKRQGSAPPPSPLEEE